MALRRRCGQPIAFLHTLAAGGRTSTTVVVIVLLALFRTPLANFSTELADLRSELAVPGERLDTPLADVNAFDAAPRAVVGARFGCHRIEAFDAGDNALLATVNAINVFRHSFPDAC